MFKTNSAKPGGRDRNRDREKEVKEFDEEVLQIDRVTRVVKGGRRLRFRCLVAIGDRKGRVAIGIGKASEVAVGIKKAITQAKQHLTKVPITKTGSIPHLVNIKYKAAQFFIMPAVAGTGVIAGGSVRKILNLAGVRNVLSKNYGSTNKLVTAQAVMRALEKLHPLKGKEAKEAPEEKFENLSTTEKKEALKEPSVRKTEKPSSEKKD